MTKTWLTAGTIVAALVNPAMAQENELPFTVDFSVELESDLTFEADDPAAEISDTFATVEAAFAMELAEGLTLNSTALIEAVQDPVDDRFLEDHGLFIEELLLGYEYGGLEIIAGKFNPAFGMAWDAAPGVFGTAFAEDYELTERWGGSVGFALDDTHSLTVSSFMADRTFLSDSLGGDRGNTDLSDGGVSNTRAPESFIISFNGESDGMAYTLAAQRQAAGQGDAEDQIGFVGGVTRSFGEIEIVAEAAYFLNFDGADDSAFVGTLGAAKAFGPVTLSAVYALRDVRNATTDQLATVSAEMEIAEGLTGAVG
ncbi:MAG: hypothetical protein ACPGGK_11330 [Pikeienuella sp.]